MSQPTDRFQPVPASEAAENAAYEEARLSPWVLQYRILKALVLRDISSRYGESRAGFLMGILLPLTAFGFIYFIFNLRGRVTPPNFPMAVFLVTGYPVWMAFQGTYARILSASSRTDPLLMFPQITQLDLIFSTLILEWATNSIVFTILMLAVTVFFHAPPSDLMSVILLYWGAMWLGGALGLMFSAIQRIVPIVIQFINMSFRLIMWVSGVIFMVDRLPAAIWPYLAWNPLLHIIEGIRQSWEPAYQAPIFYPPFVVAMGFVLTMLGLIFERGTRRFID